MDGWMDRKKMSYNFLWLCNLISRTEYKEMSTRKEDIISKQTKQMEMSYIPIAQNGTTNVKTKIVTEKILISY